MINYFNDLSRIYAIHDHTVAVLESKKNKNSELSPEKKILSLEKSGIEPKTFSTHECERNVIPLNHIPF
jgi:hypothetical protein